MSKRKKKNPIRSEFTDALSEEISARKIIERTQPKDDVLAAEVEVVEESKVDVVEEPPKVNLRKEIPLPKVEVKPETKLEERIFAEADNTFYDEPKKSTVDEKSNQSIYHSRALRKWQEDIESDEPVQNPIEEVKADERRRKLSRAEKAGIVISVAMLVYSFITLDKPLFFLAFSLFVHLLRTPVGKLSGKHEHDVRNAMRSFSMVLFVGAIIFLFMNV